MHATDDIIRLFYQYHLFSKEDLIQSFKLNMEYIEFDKETSYTRGAIKEKLRLCKKFLSLLEKSKLPKLMPEKWKYYEYEITGNSIELYLCEADSNIELSEGGTEINSMTSTIEGTLLIAESDYVTVEKFAKIQEVAPLTVQNWIRRGRLRHAKKTENGDWLIPTIEDKPNREYGLVQYTISEPMRMDEFPLVSAAEDITIYKDTDNNSVYNCSFRNYKTKFYQDMELTRKDVEELEFLLISSGKAKADSPIQYVPYIGRE